MVAGCWAAGMAAGMSPKLVLLGEFETHTLQPRSENCPKQSLLAVLGFRLRVP